jgi:peptidoglycan/LPS O-acetylase OafA/YrhL
MGTFRFLLALSIVIFHTTSLFGLTLLWGPLAVHAFFILSGFYMGLILNEKYIKKSGSYFLFITNRILRIYPLYLITIFAILAFSLVKFTMGVPGPENFFYHFPIFFSHNEHSVVTFAALADFINFIMRNLTLIFTSDYFHLTSKSPFTLLLPQAWSLQREMFFYLLVPFLARRNLKVLLAIFIIYVVIFFGWIDPHNILPKNLLLNASLECMFFFFLGMLSYKVYVFLKKMTIPPIVLYLSFLIVSVYTIFYAFVPASFHLGIGVPTDMNYCLTIAILSPFLFMLGQKIAIDKILGEIAYPIFITHIFFIKALVNIPGIPQNNSIFTLLVIGSTLIASLLFVKYIDRHINGFRQKRVVVARTS